MEQLLLASMIQSSEAYKKLNPLLEEEDFGEIPKIIFNEIQEFYQVDPEATKVDLELIKQRIESKYPKSSSLIFQALARVEELEGVSEKNLTKDFFEFKERAAKQAIVSAAVGNDSDVLDSAIDTYQRVKEHSEEVLRGARIEDELKQGSSVIELVSHFSETELVKVLPVSLNNAVDGGVPKETHILVFALTEVGKSLVVINMSYGFLKQGLKVLYIENEDPTVNTQMRFVNRFTGMNKWEVVKNPNKAEELLEEAGCWNNLIISPQWPGSISKIRRLIDKVEPDVVVVNQLHNLLSKNANKVEKLEELAVGMRTLIKEYGLIGVSVTQAADSARNKLELNDGDVYYSNVAIQSQIDLMIGIGTNETTTHNGQRMLSLCKNKISGNHSSFPVLVDPLLSKVHSI